MKTIKCIRRLGPDKDKFTEKVVFYGGYWCVFSNEDKQELFRILDLVKDDKKYVIRRQHILSMDKETCNLHLGHHAIDYEFEFDLRFSDRELKATFYWSKKHKIPFLLQECDQGFLIEGPSMDERDEQG